MRNPAISLPPKSIVRPFDIRGTYGSALTEGNAWSLGRSYATLALAESRSLIAVGRDGRLSSPSLEAALIEGLVDGGVEVMRIGLGPTPQVPFAIRHLGLDGGVMVTASHNPPADNGFKFFLGGRRLHGAGLEVMAGHSGQSFPGGSMRDVDVMEAYVSELATEAASLKPFKIAWDCGSGATGEVVKRLAARLPGHHILMNAEIDGRFPAHHPDPAVPSNLRDLQVEVMRSGCDLGIAFDGDGDRIGVVDATGAVMMADHLLLFLADDVLRQRPGCSVVADVKCSSVLFDGIRSRGGEAIMAPSGYVPVRETMRSAGAILGGELSGHIFYADKWDGTDDAIYVAVRTLQALTNQDQSIAEFREDLPRLMTTPEYRLPCTEARKGEVLSHVSENLRQAGVKVNEIDGLRVEAPEGWWLLRASNTEPCITCRCEANSKEGLEHLMDTLRHHLRAAGVDAF